MKHVEAFELQDASFTSRLFDRRAKRPGFFVRLVMALHLSRRRQARSLIRSYRHLLAADLLDHPPNTALNLNNNENIRNANADQAAIRTSHRPDRNG